MFRDLILICIVLPCAVAFSQVPTYAQQYTQRLGGAVSELERSVAEYQALAARQNMTLTEFVDSLQGNAQVEDTKAVILGQAERLRRMRADLASLSDLDWRPQSLIPRLNRFGHRDVQTGTWEAFQPALPVTLAGAMWLGLGVLCGLLIAGVLRALSRLLFGPRRARLGGPPPGRG